VEKPFAAYAGDEPYAFVSYSHRDAALVYPELSWLRGQGVNIWYDDGIRVGQNWADELANAVHNASLFLFFVTPNSVASHHCQDEINLALNRQKAMICVYLTHAALTPGLELRLSSQQAIFRHELRRETYESRLVGVIQEHLKPPTPDLNAVDSNALPGHVEANPPGHTPSQSGAIAVLPFVNRSSDPENEYFSDGMSEEILNALVKTNSVPVIARTSSFSFKGLNLTVQEIAAKLNVQYVLEGSVQKSGANVRISAQLIRTDAAVQVWSERFDRQLEDVFALQDEIARAIVREIEVLIAAPELTPLEGPQREQADPTAYDLFLRAQHHIRQVSLADQDKAVELLREALDSDPRFADGWAYLGWAYTGYLAIKAPSETAQLAKPALAKALSIDPENPLALAMMGYTQATVDYRWDEGEAMLRKAANLAPGDTVVQMALGIYLYATFQVAEAREVMERAYRLDPLSDLSVSWYADILDSSGRQNDAQRVLSAFIDTGVPGADHFMASIWMRLGELDNAERELQRFRDKWGSDNGTLRVLEYNLARLRHSIEAADHYEDLQARLARGEYMTYWWGDESNLYERARAAYENRWVGAVQLVKMNHNPRLDEFRERMNLSRLSDRSVAHPRERLDEDTEYLLLHKAQPSPGALDTYVGTYAGPRVAALRFYREGLDLKLHNLRSDALTTLIPIAENKFAHPSRVSEFTFLGDDLEELDGQVVVRRTRVEGVGRTAEEIEALRHATAMGDEEALLDAEGEYTHEYGRRIRIRLDEGSLKFQGDQGLELTLVPEGDGRFAAAEIKDTTFVFSRQDEGLSMELLRGYAKPSSSTWMKA
jgi:TolB-like protein/Tfp pilus assembly protein PilF